MIGAEDGGSKEELLEEAEKSFWRKQRRAFGGFIIKCIGTLFIDSWH